MYEKHGPPSLIVSILEDLVVLLALKTFYGEDHHHTARVLVAPTWTDTRGNGAALNKLMTTLFPASAVLMELSWNMKRMATCLW